MENWLRRLDVLKKFEDDYGVMLYEIERYVINPNTTVKLTKEEIVTYLNKVAKDHGVDMNEPDDWGGNVTLDKDFDVEARIKEFHKHMMKAKFAFNEIDYRYFNDCIKIYKDKVGKYCMIARMLTKEYPEDKKLLEDLDIKTTEREVLERDVERLFKPLVENYKLLKETVCKANNLETYLKVTLDEHAMNMDGVSYHECLPSKDLLQQYTILPRESAVSMELTEQQKAGHASKENQAVKDFLKSDLGKIILD